MQRGMTYLLLYKLLTLLYLQRAKIDIRNRYKNYLAWYQIVRLSHCLPRYGIYDTRCTPAYSIHMLSTAITINKKMASKVFGSNMQNQEVMSNGPRPSKVSLSAIHVVIYLKFSLKLKTLECKEYPKQASKPKKIEKKNNRNNWK